MASADTKHRLQPIKHLGQNFLIDDNISRKIVALVGAAEHQPVVEIGPGTGALTRFLAKKYSELHLIEVDSRSVEILRTDFPDAVVHELDVREIDWSEFGRPVFVIGNLPYYITSEILFSLFDGAPHITQAVVMTQLEVAQRLIAKPRTKEYGILSVAAQLHTTPKLEFRVSKNVFYPKPDVQSAMVSLDFRSGHARDYDAVKKARRLSREAFNQRRKTLRNSLSRTLELTQLDLPTDIAGKRAEELTPEEFVELSHYLGI